MNESIGKRIAANRKRLGLTQDALAERLGVTAQAVSKWENDQSCPDIATLPRLAEIFSCSTDSLLGLEPPSVHTETAEKEDDTQEPEGIHVRNGPWEFQWDTGRRGSLGVALWLMISGILSLVCTLRGWDVDMWHILWSSGVMVLGLMGMLRRFSALKLGAFVFGGYFLLWYMNLLPQNLSIARWDVVIPGTLLLLGVCLLADSLRKPKHTSFSMTHNGHALVKSGSHFNCDDDAFDCTTVFGNNRHLITLPRLSRGTAELSFGELEIDLRGCDAFADGCSVDVTCAFGELTLTVPKNCLVKSNISTAFAVTDVEGEPFSDATAEIYVNGRASFGEITLRYL